MTTDITAPVVPELVVADPKSRPAVTYDRWWVQTVVVRSPGPLEESSASCVLAAYSSEDGSLSGETVQLEVSALRAAAISDPRAAAAMAALVTYIEAVARERGLLA